MDRAWQKKLHASVRDDGHKAEIYKYLWMLMTEGDPTVFQNNLEAFQTFWEKKEPEFISYFKDYCKKYGANNLNICESQIPTSQWINTGCH